MEEKLLTIREAAARFERNPETVRRWIWSGRLPARKLGNQLFIRKNDLDGLRQFEASAKNSDFLKRSKALRKKILARTGEVFDISKLIEDTRVRGDTDNDMH
ncbi:MAG: helix-turn-helix domain-containing protein [Armatimonadetes bacterium]|nr:helix-turn-helix domain-containing protein [Armatimonadota bacterium]